MKTLTQHENQKVEGCYALSVSLFAEENGTLQGSKSFANLAHVLFEASCVFRSVEDKVCEPALSIHRQLAPNPSKGFGS